MARRKSLVDPALITAKRAADADLKAAGGEERRLGRRYRRSLGRHRQGPGGLPRALYALWHDGDARRSRAPTCSVSPAPWCAPRRKKPSPTASGCRNIPTAGWRCLSKTILDPQPVYPELEQATLEFWLSKLRENLTADAPGTKIFLGKDSPETLSARLWRNPSWAIRRCAKRCGTAAWRRSRPRTIP